MNNLIQAALDAGITVSMSQMNGVIFYDLNTGAKGPVVCHEVTANSLHVAMRYDEARVVHTFYDLCACVAYSMFNKPAISQEWYEVLKANNLLPEKD